MALVHTFTGLEHSLPFLAFISESLRYQASGNRGASGFLIRTQRRCSRVENRYLFGGFPSSIAARNCSIVDFMAARGMT